MSDTMATYFVDEEENKYSPNEMGDIETPFAQVPKQRTGEVEILARRLSYEENLGDTDDYEMTESQDINLTASTKKGKKKMTIIDEDEEICDCESDSEDEIRPLKGREKKMTICDDKEEEEDSIDRNENGITPKKSGHKRRRVLFELVDEEESEDDEPKRKKLPADDYDSESGIQSCSESDDDTNCKENDSDVQEIDAAEEQEDSEDEEGNLEEEQRNAANSEDDFVVDSVDDFVVDSVDDFVVDSEDDFVVDSEDDFVVDSEDDFVVDSKDEFVVNSEDDFDSDDDDVVDSEEDFDSDDDDVDSDGNSAADSGDDLTVNPPGEVSALDSRDDAVDSRDDDADSRDDAADSGDDSAVDVGGDFTVLSGHDFALDSGDDFDVDSGDDFEELTDDEKENIDENNNASKRSKNEPYPAKLMEHLRPMSHEKEIQYKMMREWTFDHLELLDDCSGVCPCGKRGIKRKYYIKNRVTGFLTHVGSVCIDLFGANMKIIADVVRSLINDGFVGKCQIRDPIKKLVQVTTVREGTKIEKHNVLIKKYFRKIPIVKCSGKTFVNLVKVPDSEMKKLKVGEEYRIWAEMCTNKDVLEVKMLKCKREVRRELAHQNQFIWN